MPAKEIVQHIFKHPSLENISVEELQNVARQYPYFSIVQLLLAKKKYELQPEEYLQQLGIANLYAGNPFVLHQYFYSKPVEELPATNEEQNTTAELSPEEENYRRKETEEIINEISIPENVTGEISGEEIITSPDETMQEENVEEEIVQEIEVKDEAVVEEIVQNEEIIQNEEPIQNDEIKQADEIIAEEIVQDEVREVIPENEIVQDENAPQADMPEAALPEEIISS